MALRMKYMVKDEFAQVADRDWVPVMLSGEGKPAWVKGAEEAGDRC